MSILFYACKKDEDVNETLFFGYQYIPIHEGDERFYQVDSIIYDDFTGLVDTVRFQLLEQVEGLKGVMDVTDHSYRENAYYK